MKYDVRSKVLLVILANLTFLFRVEAEKEWVLIFGFLFLLYLAGKGRIAMIYGLHFLVFLLLLAYGGGLEKIGLGSLLLVATAARLMLPALMAGSLLIQTTSAYELIHGLQKWKVPEVILITLSVMLRFFPLIREDYRAIRQNLRLRGLFLERREILLHLGKYGEYVLVPLLASLVRQVESLVVASMTKGLALKQERTETFVSRFRWIDWGICGWILSMLLWIMW
ncbi:energy-coupling factor transporter transmembrane component T [Streptococcus pneumoniae]